MANLTGDVNVAANAAANALNSLLEQRKNPAASLAQVAYNMAG